MEREATSVAVDLPRLRNPADCGRAIDQIAEGVATGTADLAVAKVLFDAIRVRVKTIETQELEQRLAELEKAAASVDLGGSHPRS